MVLLSSAGVHAQEAYQLLTNASLTHYELAYLSMFGIPLFGAAALRRALPRWLRITSLAGFASTLFSLAISAYPFVTVVSAKGYAARILGTILVSNLIALGFYALRARAAARTKAALSPAA